MKAIASFMTMIIYANCLGCCSCPDVLCSRGVWIVVTPLDGTVLPGDGDYVVIWRTDHEAGEVSSDVSFDEQGEVYEISFNIRTLSPPTPEIEIELYYNYEQIGETETYPLDWTERHCKSCGDAAWCEQIYVSEAVVEIGLDEAL